MFEKREYYKSIFMHMQLCTVLISSHKLPDLTVVDIHVWESGSLHFSMIRLRNKCLKFLYYQNK